MTWWNAWHVRFSNHFESGEMWMKTPSSWAGQSLGRVHRSTKVDILFGCCSRIDMCTWQLGVILLSLRNSWRRRRMRWRRWRRTDKENNLVSECFVTLSHFLVLEDGATEESTLHPWSCMPTRRDVEQQRTSPKMSGSSMGEATVFIPHVWILEDRHDHMFMLFWHWLPGCRNTSSCTKKEDISLSFPGWTMTFDLLWPLNTSEVQSNRKYVIETRWLIRINEESCSGKTRVLFVKQTPWNHTLYFWDPKEYTHPCIVMCT